MKICSICKQDLPLTSFDTQVTGKQGCRADCKECRKRFLRTERGLVKSMLAAQKAKSKKRNHPAPSYTEDDLFEWLLAQDNFQELFKAWINAGYPTEIKPSIDRIDDYQPYTLSNIRLVTHAQNIQRFYVDLMTGVNTKRCQAVNQYDLDGNFIQQFHSFKAASRAVNVNASAIRAVAKQITVIRQNTDGSTRTYTPKQAAGFIWKLA